MANVYILPNISAFVGADIVAGILAIRMYENEKIFLFIDLGTNGEIVFRLKEKNVDLLYSSWARF